MLKLCFVWLFVLFPIANAADCPMCPTGGIWSEWATKEACATTCGACSKVTYTRTCLSDALKNCPCVGDKSIIKPCNTQACNYPRANGPALPCCVGSPTVINNWYHCANSSQSVSKPPCCPTGGIWGDWSTWVRNGDLIEWSRSRSCLSGGFNCVCVGDHEQTKMECPCAPLKLIKNTTDANGNYDNECIKWTLPKFPWDLREPIFYAGKCQTSLLLDSSNLRRRFYYPNSEGKPTCTTGYIDLSGECKVAEFPTGDLYTHGQYWKFTFNCNPATGAWDRDFVDIGLKMRGVTRIAQFVGML